MPSIAAAEAQIRADGRPVLYLDTCVLLDVIRAPARGLNGCVQAATNLRALLTSAPPQGTFVVASMVSGEWNNNAATVRDEVRAHHVKTQNYAQHFHDACGTLGIALVFGRPSYDAVGLAEALFDLSQQLLGLAVELEPDTGCLTRGVGRVVTKTPPSSQGGEVKDCVIVEECLELTRQLRANGFARKCVFCTSNVNDYGTPNPTLAAEFAAVNLGFTTKLPWAVHELTH